MSKKLKTFLFAIMAVIMMIGCAKQDVLATTNTTAEPPTIATDAQETEETIEMTECTVETTEPAETIVEGTTEPVMITDEEPEAIEEKQTLEEFLNGIEDPQNKEFYRTLYEIYDFETFPYRSNIPLYFQTTYTQPFANGTIRSAGCGITSLSMICTYLYDEVITPDMMLKYQCSTEPAATMENAIRIMNMNCTKYYGMAALENLDIAIENDCPIIVLYRGPSLFTEGGHFVVIAGKNEEGKYIVNDPNLENYYKSWMVDRFVNGFSRQDIIYGLCGIYIFDSKTEFVDMRNIE